MCFSSFSRERSKQKYFQILQSNENNWNQDKTHTTRAFKIKRQMLLHKKLLCMRLQSSFIQSKHFECTRLIFSLFPVPCCFDDYTYIAMLLLCKIQTMRDGAIIITTDPFSKVNIKSGNIFFSPQPHAKQTKDPLITVVATQQTFCFGSSADLFLKNTFPNLPIHQFQNKEDKEDICFCVVMRIDKQLAINKISDAFQQRFLYFDWISLHYSLSDCFKK